MASASRAGTWPPWLKEAHLGVLTRGLLEGLNMASPSP